MKLEFKTQAYQTAAVQAVVDCFAGARHGVRSGGLRPVATRLPDPIPVGDYNPDWAIAFKE
jgi:restriction endonuclease